MFNQLYRLGNEVASESDTEDVWVAAANGDGEAAAMVTYYNDDDSAGEKAVKISFGGVSAPNGVRLEYYLHDKDHDCELMREEIFTADTFAAYVKMPLNSTYLFKIIKL